MQNLQNWLEKSRQALGSGNPFAAETMAQKVLHIGREEIVSSAKEINLSPKQLRKMHNLLGRVLAGRNIYRAVKRCEFHNINLIVNSKVLAPRAETEALVWWAENNLPKHATVLDIGSGSGCIGLSLARANASLNIKLLDLSRPALLTSKRNAKLNNLNRSNLDFYRSNLLNSAKEWDLSESFFIANLPYVQKQTVSKKSLQDPKLSLYANNKGLGLIKKLLQQISQLDALGSNNWILIEHDKSQTTRLAKFCSDRDWVLEEISAYISLVKRK